MRRDSRVHVAAALALTGPDRRARVRQLLRAEPRAARALARATGARRRRSAPGPLDSTSPESMVLTIARSRPRLTSRGVRAQRGTRRGRDAHWRSSNHKPSDSVCAGHAPRPPAAADCWRLRTLRSGVRRPPSSSSVTTWSSNGPVPSCASECAAAVRGGAPARAQRCTRRWPTSRPQAPSPGPNRPAPSCAPAERRRRRGNGSLRSLTPQELQVALIVAKGATNREVAPRCFSARRQSSFICRTPIASSGCARAAN